VAQPILAVQWALQQETRACGGFVVPAMPAVPKALLEWQLAHGLLQAKPPALAPRGQMPVCDMASARLTPGHCEWRTCKKDDHARGMRFPNRGPGAGLGGNGPSLVGRPSDRTNRRCCTSDGGAKARILCTPCVRCNGQSRSRALRAASDRRQNHGGHQRSHCPGSESNSRAHRTAVLAGRII
jgi:hypothetical protein